MRCHEAAAASFCFLFLLCLLLLLVLRTAYLLRSNNQNTLHHNHTESTRKINKCAEQQWFSFNPKFTSPGVISFHMNPCGMTKMSQCCSSPIHVHIFKDVQSAHTHTHTHTHTDAYLYVYTYAFAYMRRCVRTCNTYTYTRTCVHAAYSHPYVRACAQMLLIGPQSDSFTTCAKWENRQSLKQE